MLRCGITRVVNKVTVSHVIAKIDESKKKKKKLSFLETRISNNLPQQFRSNRGWDWKSVRERIEEGSNLWVKKREKRKKGGEGRMKIDSDKLLPRLGLRYCFDRWEGIAWIRAKL